MPDCAFCHCSYETHQHLRAGDDCGRCRDCRSYKDPRSIWRRLAEFVSGR